MTTWYRVFANTDRCPARADVEARLARAGLLLSSDFDEDEQGWYRAAFRASDGSETVVERWMVSEEGIRAELNAWAGVVETYHDQPGHEALMERIIQSQQLFTLEATPLAVVLAQTLCELVEGFYQRDGEGFFSAEGIRLIEEK